MTPEFVHGLRPRAEIAKILVILSLYLEGGTGNQWKVCQTNGWKVIQAPDGLMDKGSWLRLPDGHTEHKAPLVAEVPVDDLEAVSPDAIEVHWDSKLGMFQRHSLSISHYIRSLHHQNPDLRPSSSIFQKNPRVRKNCLPSILGPEMAAPILWALGKMRSFCRKNQCP